MSLTDDVYDAGVLAYKLIEGLGQDNFADTESMSVRSHMTFQKDNWSKVSK